MGTAMNRRPAVAGSFYPADPETLRKELDGLMRGRRSSEGPPAVALMVPHAGYIYSGPVAADTYAATRLPRRFVIIGPNHTGRGKAIAIMAEGAWATPFGEAPIDEPLAAAILAGCPASCRDDVAHQREHSLEVQVPFLQYIVGDFCFVPICVGTQDRKTLLALGRALAEAISATGDEVLILISSDMSHYLPASLAERQDRKALDRFLAIDPEGLHEVVVDEEISMCGISPAVAGLEASRRLGAREARLIRYSNSGERSGDLLSVVGYAGVAVT
jgi:hypothetical protein